MKLEYFTEQTIKTEGWYFFYPSFPGCWKYPQFMYVVDEVIVDGYLKCRAYTGTYIGPYEQPPLEPHV